MMSADVFGSARQLSASPPVLATVPVPGSTVGEVSTRVVGLASKVGVDIAAMAVAARGDPCGVESTRGEAVIVCESSFAGEAKLDGVAAGDASGSSGTATAVASGLACGVALSAGKAQSESVPAVPVDRALDENGMAGSTSRVS